MTILFIFCLVGHSQIRIKMQKENGVYSIPCMVNGLRMKFIFDTGASTVTISLFEATFMLKNGYLHESDLRGSSFAQLANGQIVENTIINLKEVEIGGIKLQNIEAAIVNNLEAPLLLGQTLIEKLGKIQIENDELIILSTSNNSTSESCTEALKLIYKAQGYYKNRLKSLCLETYQKAYDLCFNMFTPDNIMQMAICYQQSENAEIAIEYYQKAISKYLAYENTIMFDSSKLSFAYQSLGSTFIDKLDYYNAQLNLEKALAFAIKDNELALIYYDFGSLLAKQSKHFEAIDFLKKSTVYYLKYLDKTLEEVSLGKVKDDLLAEIFYNLSVNYGKINNISQRNINISRSALCGNESAIEFCKNNKIIY
jgi:clan AA aspartic protease (TIGR02281 family)